MNKIIYILMLFFTFSEIHAEAQKQPKLFSDGGINSLIATMDTFKISVSDQVTGGCLPNPNELKDKLEISLRKNGFKIAKKDELFSNVININVLGYKTSASYCAVYISTDLDFLIFAKVPYSYLSKEKGATDTAVGYRYNIGSHLLAGDRNSMQSRLEKTIVDYGDKLFLDISRAKDDIFTKFPYIEENYKKIKQ